MESNPDLVSRFMGTTEYIQGSEQSRQIWLQRFQALSPEEPREVDR